MKIARDTNNCFSPVSDSNARVLILGSFPGRVSLSERQYYAHPRNVFWKIMSTLFEFDYNLDYEGRTARLKHYGVALWDVVYSCRRDGSLDSAIQDSTVVVNNFEEFFFEHTEVKAIFFNGGKAEKEFRTKALPLIGLSSDSLFIKRLPSTSPAFASMSFNEKLESWREIRDFL